MEIEHTLHVSHNSFGGRNNESQVGCNGQGEERNKIEDF